MSLDYVIVKVHICAIISSPENTCGTKHCKTWSVEILGDVIFWWYNVCHLYTNEVLPFSFFALTCSHYQNDELVNRLYFWNIEKYMCHTVQLWTKWIITVMMAMRRNIWQPYKKVFRIINTKIIRSLLTDNNNKHYNKKNNGQMFSSIAT